MAPAPQPTTERSTAPSGRRRPIVAVVRGDARRPAADPDATYDVVPVLADRRVVDRILAARPDALLVDLDGPALDAVRLCRTLRAAVSARIVVVATTALDDARVVELLDAGADDVVIGASAAVVTARVRVALRANPAPPPQPAILTVGDVVVDLGAHEVRIAGTPVLCPPVQYELLATLARHEGTAIAGEELLRTVWGTAPGDVHPRRLRIAISVLRGILGIGPARPRVETVPRMGYRLVSPSKR